jgi:hypothetical protein
MFSDRSSCSLKDVMCVMCVMWVFSSLLGIGFEFRGCAMLEKAMVRGAKGSDGQTTTRD